uniref:Chromo domain-containing protein n=1 Tax=Haemonchus contortus TaxID=6289 RepID=A0A7I4YL59_HAECO
MAASRRNLCRRKYDELSDQFFAEIDEICQKHRYTKDDIDRSMKRLLKIAEFRDPTPNDVSMSTSLGNITKEHLESFLVVFRDLVERPVEDATVNGETDTMSQPSSDSDSDGLKIEDVLPSPSESSDSEHSCVNLDEVSSDTEEEQYEVERIISRTVNAEGKYVYHIKWKGYETSSDPENFVDEENMHCPELIEEFERLEKLKKKQRAKRLEEQAILARKRKLEAERRAKAAFSLKSRSSSDEEHRRKSCKEINLCSSTSSSEEEDKQLSPELPNIKHRSRSPPAIKNAVPSRSPNRQRKKKKHKSSSSLKKRINWSSTSSEDDEVGTNGEKEQFVNDFPSENIKEESNGTTVSEDTIDPEAAFKYIMRETDGFRKGYKAVKVSVVCEHPITKKLVAVVVFTDPLDDHEFAQYIPFRETVLNAPQELRDYFTAADNADPKNLALSLVLQYPNKPP